MAREKMSPDYLFEVSWEVCNKVGGIHTVLATKANAVASQMEGVHIVVGPDILRDSGEGGEFEEDKHALWPWVEQAQASGLRIRVGRWRIPSHPLAVLVDYTTFIPQKDSILAQLWEEYQLDSLEGQWDYIEPLLFGYAAGVAIELFVRNVLSPSHRVVAQFHEWMTGAGILYLKRRLPQVATAFTTHATVLGRCIAGNGLPLYDQLNSYVPLQKAKEFRVTSKHSLETLSARQADVYTTVSEITARECEHFHGKKVDLCTPNGFEMDFVPTSSEFKRLRQQARARLLGVANALLEEPLPAETLLVATSGRYEFKNKGLDLFIDALHTLSEQEALTRPVAAFMLIPAGQQGPRRDVPGLLPNSEPAKEKVALTERRITHYLSDGQHDPILNRLNALGMQNEATSRVKIFYVPCYLNGHDGVFDLSYYDLLIGMDVTVFPSYYEPWGYTPLESLAFHVPTVTTTLAGFGLWASEHAEKMGGGLRVLKRTDGNYAEVQQELAQRLLRFSQHTPEEEKACRDDAAAMANIALWDNLLRYYLEAYSLALERASGRAMQFAIAHPVRARKNEDLREEVAPPKWQRMLVVRNIPHKLSALDEIAHNLWWCWHPEAEQLFKSIDEALWEECENNPVMLLDRISYRRLESLAEDEGFIARLAGLKAQFDSYMREKPAGGKARIAYFSMEYGLHSSLKLYSGGLGVLAGDYLKEASDRNIDLVAVGLFYRYGYFTQRLSHTGEQLASYNHQNFTQTPAQAVRDGEGKWLTVRIGLPGREVHARVWVVYVGRIPLYLLDTDFEDNLEQDRTITHQLYGGDSENRFKQEMVLGVGGMRALEAAGQQVGLLHLNEGHAAFAALERLRQCMGDKQLAFDEAIELVRASTLFTTHTPVPAGHDRFDETLVRTYMSHYPGRFTISWDRFMSFGRMHPGDKQEKFSMSNLAANLSVAMNGVSLLHGAVSQKMFAGLWPGYYPSETHVGYVTNGVHYPTWIADLWRPVLNPTGDMDALPAWENVENISDERLWGIRNKLRARLIESVTESVMSEEVLKSQSPGSVIGIRDTLRADHLTIGFARRFATYKRAHLLFTDLDRLDRIVNNPDRPVQFLFAGKAHPHDKAGQDLIKRIFEISQRPRFLGKILFLPNYDMALAHRLVQGVDVWLNTPTRPQEASGTSGMKAVMNGCLHFSVLDGWWVEGYEPGAGWALSQERTYSNQAIQDELDAGEIYSLIENEIAPIFYRRTVDGIPTDWLGYIRRSMGHIAPRFSSTRMQQDYFDRFYNPMQGRLSQLEADHRRRLFELVDWKQHMLQHWDAVQVIREDRIEMGKQSIETGKHYVERVLLDCGQIRAEWIGLELVTADLKPGSEEVEIRRCEPFTLIKQEGTRAEYEVKISPLQPGAYDLAIRMYATHPLLPHRMDFNLMRWI